MCKNFQQMLKKSNKTIWENSIELTENYFKNHYLGTEHDEIKIFYAPFLWIEILDYLQSKYHEEKKKIKPKKFNILKVMKKIKTITYEQRKGWYLQWLGKIKTKEKIVNILQKIYPKCENKNEVKKELGLMK